MVLPSSALEEFGTFRLPLRTQAVCLAILLATSQTSTTEVEMTMLKQRSGADTDAAKDRKAVIVRGGAGYRAEQGSDYLPGISSETVGAAALWLGIATIPPGQRTKAHVHERHETAFYMLSGDELEMWSGDELQHRDVVHPGDYLYIPANVLHVAVNRGGKPAVFIGSRNEPTAQESVVLYPEMDDRVP
jgi:uncharacterized RmlC-like cupin family protein